MVAGVITSAKVPTGHSREQTVSRRGVLQPGVLSSSEIAAIDPHSWNRLSRASVADNPFYSSCYVKAGLTTIDKQSGLRAFALRFDPGKLAGLFLYRERLGVARAARNIYQFSTAPLVHSAAAGKVVDSWMHQISTFGLPPVWCFRDFPVGGELFELLRRRSPAHGLQLAVVNEYRRARLVRMQGGLPRHLEEVVPKGRRKEIDRSERRLRQIGQLEFERATKPALLRQRLEQFLEMERSGWKGEAGSAFLCKADDAKFARSAFGASIGGRASSSIDSLLLDGVPIAMSINIAVGSTGYTPKCAFDERFRKWGPGILLEYYILREFYRDKTWTAMDSATTANGHAIEGLWNERVKMGTLVIGKGVLVPLTARILEALGLARERVKAALRRSPTSSR